MVTRRRPKSESNSSPPGATFHRLIETIEKSLAGTTGYSVEAPKYLKDKDTGRMREHDVVLTFRHGHHVHLTAVECRDRSRRTGVPDVEQFQKKCERTGVHRPMMVSQRGFTKSALSKAAAMGVECFTLDEIEAFPWCLARHVTIQSPTLLSGRFLPSPQPPNVETMSLFARPGVLIDAKLRHLIAQQCIAGWRQGEDRQAGRYKTAFTLHGSEYYFVDGDGAEHSVDEMRVELVFELVDSVSPMIFRKYRSATGEDVADVASAQLKFGERNARVLMIGPPDGDKEVLLAFD